MSFAFKIMPLTQTKIAVVEDEKGMRQLLSLIFSRGGCEEVSLHSSGKEFLSFYEGNVVAPDVVLLDMAMPGMWGFEVLAEALQNESFRQTLFIAMSAYITNHDMKWLRDIGFDYVIQKPFSTDEVLKIVESLLETRSEILSKRNPYKNMYAAIQELSKLRLRSSILENDYIKKLISPKVFAILDSSPDSLIPRNREVAIGFADIRNFTQLMNRLQVQQVAEVLRLFFGQSVELITKENGHLDKFIGDEVMWFHESDSIEESCNRCIRVAVSMQRIIKEVNKAIQNRLHLKLNIQIGVGVACGTAAIGIFGAPNYRFQYTVLGPPVNLAARLCSEAIGGEILIGGEAIEFCPFKTKKKGFRAIQGFDHEVELRRVIFTQSHNAL